MRPLRAVTVQHIMRHAERHEDGRAAPYSTRSMNTLDPFSRYAPNGPRRL